MATTMTFNLKGATFDGDNFSTGASISVNGTATASLKAAAPSFDVTGGTFFAGKDKMVAFTADDELAGKTVVFENGEAEQASIGTATFTSGNDIVSLTTDSVKAYMGKGDDIVYAAGGKADAPDVVFLGEGKDKVQLQKDDAHLKIADYNYADGDVLETLADKLDGAGGVKEGLLAQAGGLNAFDAITVGGATVSAADDGNGVFKVRVQDTVGNGVEYWGATSNKTVNMDGTTFGTDTTLILDGSKAKSAVIMGGFGKDSIYVNGGGNTVAIQKAGNIDTVTGFTTVLAGDVNGDMANYKGDTLWFADGSLSDVSLSGTDAIFLNNGGVGQAATLQGVVAKDVGVGKVTFDGTNIKNVMYDNTDAAGGVMQASVKGVDAYLGHKGNNQSTLVAGYKDISGTVNLWDTDVYQNISYVSLSAGNKDENVAFVGAAAGNTTLDAKSYTGKVAALVTGAANTVSLNAAASLSDTIWWGGTAQDSVYGFEGGYDKTKSDVLKLYDTADISGIKGVSSVGSSAAETKLELANGKSLYTSLTAVGDEVQVLFKDAEAAKKVAFDNGSGVVTLTAAADYILGQSATRTSSSATKVSLSGGYTDSAAINLWDTTANRNVLDVDAGKASLASEVLVVGSQTSTSYVTLNGAVNSQVWTANKGENEVSVTDGDKAVIWYAGSFDGNDKVTGNGASVSTYKLWDAASFDDIVKNYNFSASGTNVVLKGKDGGSLTIAASKATVSGFKVEDSENKVYKANLADNKVEFATDVDIYGGGASVLAFDSAYKKGDEADIVLGGTFAGKYYDNGISEVDGLATQGKLVVVGNTDKGTKFRGGKQENAFWGASADSDTFYANSLAVDTFWYSTQDGNDTFKGATGGQDSVYLYGISSNDIDTVITNYELKGDTAVLTFENKSTLTIDNSALTNGLTFTTNDGVNYKYDAAAKKLAKA